MFFYPDPEPIEYCITDVSPSYLTDGVFFNGHIGPTHKRVAKQLSAIPRGPNDPVAPRAKVNPRTLENWTVDSKAWYVDNCGRNAKALYSMMKLLPQEKIDLYAGWKSKVALFPRSEQYEYWYMEKERINGLEKQVEKLIPKLTEAEEENASLEPELMPAFEYTKTPIWWRDKIPTRTQSAVGIPDDYDFKRLDPPDAEKTLIHKKLNSKNPGAYVPGDIYRQERKQENEMPESLDAEDSVKVAIDGEGEDIKDFNGDCSCSSNETHYQHKSLMYKTRLSSEDLKRGETDPAVKLDPRWHSWHEVCDVPRNDVDRKTGMSNLYRPYYHEINTWYSRYKPTKQIPALILEGKRPILEWHFSNL